MKKLISLLAITFLACSSSHHNDLGNENDGGVSNNQEPGNSASSSSGSNNSNSDNASSSGSNPVVVDAGTPPPPPPTPTDGIKNQDETSIDCGGKHAPPCALGKNCKVHSDCTTDVCNYKGVCIAETEKSCAAQFGGDTCGVGEVGDPQAQHESCCTKLPLPSGIQLDKYKLTAGRMRAMIEATNGDVKGWYQTNRSKLRMDAVAQIDPYVSYLPSALTGVLGSYSVAEQLGSYIYLPDQPSTLQGCYVAGNGTHTYWLPPDVNAQYGDIAQGFSQEQLDPLPLNCFPLPIAFAFCAWDGGRMQTREENDTAYGTATYGWGNTPEAGGFDNVDGGWGVVGPATLGFKAVACPTCDTTMANWRHSYQYPVGGNPAVPSDYSYFISAPGRFPKDKGPYGHLDITALMIEATGTPSDYIDPKGRNTIVFGQNGSWEAHEPGYKTYAFNAMTKYGKFAGRCAY